MSSFYNTLLFILFLMIAKNVSIDIMNAVCNFPSKIKFKYRLVIEFNRNQNEINFDSI